MFIVKFRIGSDTVRTPRCTIGLVFPFSTGFKKTFPGNVLVFSSDVKNRRRERERERERWRDRDRQTDRKTDREIRRLTVPNQNNAKQCTGPTTSRFP